MLIVMHRCNIDLGIDTFTESDLLQMYQNEEPLESNEIDDFIILKKSFQYESLSKLHASFSKKKQKNLSLYYNFYGLQPHSTSGTTYLLRYLLPFESLQWEIPIEPITSNIFTANQLDKYYYYYSLPSCIFFALYTSWRLVMLLINNTEFSSPVHKSNISKYLYNDIVENYFVEQFFYMQELNVRRRAFHKGMITKEQFMDMKTIPLAIETEIRETKVVAKKFFCLLFQKLDYSTLIIRLVLFGMIHKEILNPSQFLFKILETQKDREFARGFVICYQMILNVKSDLVYSPTKNFSTSKKKYHKLEKLECLINDDDKNDKLFRYYNNFDNTHYYQSKMIDTTIDPFEFKELYSYDLPRNKYCLQDKKLKKIENNTNKTSVTKIATNIEEDNNTNNPTKKRINIDNKDSDDDTDYKEDDTDDEEKSKPTKKRIKIQNKDSDDENKDDDSDNKEDFKPTKKRKIQKKQTQK